MRLNGWQKVGLVLSIVWLVGAAIHQRNSDISQADSQATFAYNICAVGQSATAGGDLKYCQLERAKTRTLLMGGSWGNVAFMALVPIPLAWLAAFILIYVGKAQAIGFRAVIPWRSLTQPKRAFVVFCILVIGLVAYLGLLTLMGMYVDTKVPVALGTLKDFSANDDWVSASGTWTPTNETPTLGTPLQISTLSCRKDEGHCVEAKASVMTGMGTASLFSDLNEYPIQSWSTTTIVFTYDGLCATNVYTIDLKTQTINWVGHTIEGPKSLCLPTASRKDHWSYQLEAGFPTYWKLRQQARPFLMRLMQAVFGA